MVGIAKIILLHVLTFTATISENFFRSVAAAIEQLSDLSERVRLRFGPWGGDVYGGDAVN